MNHDTDAMMTRDRGILTPEDREFLRGDKSYEYASGTRRARRRIRDRVRNSVSDFGLLFEYMERRDRLQVLDKFAERSDSLQAEFDGEEYDDAPPELEWDILYEPEVVWYGIFTGGFRSMTAFTTLLMFDQLVDRMELPPEKFVGLIGALMEKGLEDAIGKKGIVVDADVDVQITEIEVDPEKLRERFEAGHEEVSDQEVEWLIHLREIDHEEYVEYLEDKRNTSD